MMVLLMLKASAKAWKRWQAERQVDDSRMTRGKTANPKLEATSDAWISHR